jgi:hypothetical protein
MDPFTELMVFFGVLLVVVGLLGFLLYCLSRVPAPPIVTPYNCFTTQPIMKNPCAEVNLPATPFPMGHPFGPLQRYNDDGVNGMSLDPDGDFVKFEEHQQQVRKLQLQRDSLGEKLTYTQHQLDLMLVKSEGCA